MKTTVDIPDDLLMRAKEVALKRRTSLKKMVEIGLRFAVESPEPSSTAHPLDAIAELGKGDWNGVDADAYVANLRKGWE